MALFRAIAATLALTAGALDSSAASPEDKGKVDQAIATATAYLAAQARPDGRFIYRVNTNTDIDIEPRYNWLRHAGSIYALSSAYQENPDTELARTIRSTARRLVDTIRPVEGKSNLLAVWDDPVAERGGLAAAKLGGAGLALVALTAAHRAGLNTPVELLAGLGDFILAMQKPDGSFYSKFIPAKGGQSDHWTSLYYPGEAAFGLVQLFGHVGAPQYLFGAIAALGFLAESRKSADTVPADHWSLIATQAIWPFLDDDNRDLLKWHARQVVTTILAEQISEPGSSFDGGFSADGRITPTAIRIEGLLAAASFFSASDELRDRIDNSASRAVDFLMRNQIATGAHEGGFTRAVRPFRPDEPFFDSAFNRRSGEIRIDYVQHALSALLDWRVHLAEMLLSSN